MKRPPIDVLPLIPGLNEELSKFLRSLSREDWLKQTVARRWVVKDVAAHLLDGNLRKISRLRDNWRITPTKPVNTFDNLVVYLNELNQEWVDASKRISPELITEWLIQSNEEVLKIYNKLDPFAKSDHSVAWAGQVESYNWFDIARQYTELFVHQQQMRDAVGTDSLLQSKFYYPFLNVFMQALPYTYRSVNADNGTSVKVQITGPGEGSWYISKSTDGWQLVPPFTKATTAEAIVDGRVAWKLFSKSVRKQDVIGSYELRGNRSLAEHALNMVSVMA